MREVVPPYGSTRCAKRPRAAGAGMLGSWGRVERDEADVPELERCVQRLAVRDAKAWRSEQTEAPAGCRLELRVVRHRLTSSTTHAVRGAVATSNEDTARGSPSRRR